MNSFFQVQQTVKIVIKRLYILKWDCFKIKKIKLVFSDMSMLKAGGKIMSSERNSSRVRSIILT